MLQSLSYLAMFMPAVADSEAVTNGERVSGNLVGIVQRNDSLQFAGRGSVYHETTALGDERNGSSQRRAARHDDTFRLLADGDAKRLNVQLGNHSELKITTN